MYMHILVNITIFFFAPIELCISFPRTIPLFMDVNRSCFVLLNEDPSSIHKTNVL